MTKATRNNGQSDGQPLRRSERLKKATSNDTKTIAPGLTNQYKPTSPETAKSTVLNTGERYRRTSSYMTQSSKLLRLPPELRNTIYEYVLTDEGSIRVDLYLENPHPRKHRLRLHATSPAPRPYVFGRPKTRFALLRTCKQTHGEASDLFYACKCFVVRPSAAGQAEIEDQLSETPEDILATLTAFNARIGDSRAKAIRDLTLYIEEPPVSSLYPKRPLFTKGRGVGPKLLGVFREMRRLHLQRPYWNLKASLDCQFLTTRGSDIYYVHKLEVDMHDPRAVLDHAVSVLHSDAAIQSQKGADLYNRDVKYCARFLQDLKDGMARSLTDFEKDAGS